LIDVVDASYHVLGRLGLCAGQSGRN